MKIALINPPVEDFFFTPARAYPLGLLSLGTVLKSDGHEVSIINCPADTHRATVAMPDSLVYLTRYYYPRVSPFKLFAQYYRFGISEESVCAQLRSMPPDVVGIAANFTAYADQALAIAARVKTLDPRVTVVIGGRAATAAPEHFLASDAVDYVMRGEAEHSLRELCRYIARHESPGDIPGLCRVLKSGTYQIAAPALIDDLESLPMIDRSLINSDHYRFRGNMFASLIASRGCVHHCRFCAIHEPFRYRRAARVLEEVRDCYQRGIRHFNFEDDTINLHPEFRQIVAGISAIGGREVRLSFMNGVLAQGIDLPLRRALITAGLTHIDLSIASSQDRLRAALHRRDSIPASAQLARDFAHDGIVATVHHIIAFPGQTFEEAADDIRFLAQEPVMLGPSIFYPVVESPLFAQVTQSSALRQEDYRVFRSSAACYDVEISRDRIFTLMSCCRVVNFIKDLMQDCADCPPTLTRLLAHYRDAEQHVPELRRAGLVLLEPLRGEYRLMTMVRTAGGTQNIVAEPFADPADMRRILSGMTIQSVRGDTLVFV